MLNIQEVVSAVPNPCIYVDQNRYVTASNSAAGFIVGVGQQNKHYMTLLRQPQLLDAVETCLREKSPVKARFVDITRCADVSYLTHVRPLNNGAMIVFEDRTATEEINQFRQDFIANVSHELKTPLTSIAGFIETLQGAASNDDKARKRFLDIMQQEAMRMKHLIDGLLKLSKVQEQTRIQPVETVDIIAVLNIVIDRFTPIAQKKGFKIVSQFETATVNVFGDQSQLIQLFSNLIENALKYGASPIKITVSSEGEQSRIDISDQGCGIDSIHIPRLTERFYRIDDHRARSVGGTGLGLAIVKHIVNRHRGRMFVTSDKGGGTVFSVRLPLKK